MLSNRVCAHEYRNDIPINRTVDYSSFKVIPQVMIITINGHSLHVQTYPHYRAFENALMQTNTLEEKHGLAFDARLLKPVRISLAKEVIALDFLFINAQKRITCIAANITSSPTNSVGCNTPVHSVLVLNAGEAQLLQLQIGDKVEGLIKST